MSPDELVSRLIRLFPETAVVARQISTDTAEHISLPLDVYGKCSAVNVTVDQSRYGGYILASPLIARHLVTKVSFWGAELEELMVDDGLPCLTCCPASA